MRRRPWHPPSEHECCIGELVLAEIRSINRKLDRLEEKTMTALSDLLSADQALKDEVAAFLADIAGRLGTVDDASAEAVVADIQTEIAALQAADVPPATS